MKRALAIVLLVLGACGGTEPVESHFADLTLLGKPCTSDADCDSANGVTCSQINFPADRACEFPVTAEAAAASDCPTGTAIWGAALHNSDGSYASLAYYCAPLCRHDSDCAYGRQCFSRCGL